MRLLSYMVPIPAKRLVRVVKSWEPVMHYNVDDKGKAYLTIEATGVEMEYEMQRSWYWRGKYR